VTGCGLCTGGLSVFLGYGRRKVELDDGFGGRFEVSTDGDGDTALKLSANLSF